MAKSNNTLLYAGLGLAALFIFKKKSTVAGVGSHHSLRFTDYPTMDVKREEALELAQAIDDISRLYVQEIEAMGYSYANVPSNIANKVWAKYSHINEVLTNEYDKILMENFYIQHPEYSHLKK